MADLGGPTKCTALRAASFGRPHSNFTICNNVPDDSTPSQQVENHRRACTQVPFVRKARIFFTFRNSDRPADTFLWSEIPLQMKNARSALRMTKSHLRGDAKD